MKIRRDGGPAFGFGDLERGGDEGMSLRDWFAGQALPGLLAHASGVDPCRAPAAAYMLADMMLAEREREQEE